MPQVRVDMAIEDIKAMILQLTEHEFLVLMEAIEERTQTISTMRLAETGFREWDEAGEDIYCQLIL